MEQSGSKLAASGRDIADLQAKGKGLSKRSGDAPPETSAALESVASEWSGGLARLGDLVTGLGGFTSGVGRLFALVEGVLTESDK
ncbi:MAG: hypothetical protein M3N28_02225 [Actinomycetota bacterium]|nr:hypothetical protein [Actinomycetota bacterium]